MLIILSPAKTMDMRKADIAIPESRPKYVKDAEFLAEKMQYYSVQELEKLLKVSEKLAEENHTRYEVFDSPTTRKSRRYWRITAVCSGK